MTDQRKLRGEWDFPEGITYFNHGSFGPSPREVIAERERITRRLESQPMQFFLREMEDDFEAAYRVLGKFVGADHSGLLFVRNATEAMNIVAASIPLTEGDEVLLTDHEYGAVHRIWGAAARRCGARVITASLGDDFSDADKIVANLFASATDRTRVVVVSHITSPTALILPVQRICAEAKRRGIVACVDGPHAPAMIDVSLKSIGCDFYCASCHKWMSAPFGSGFLYVSPGHRGKLNPVNVSWGQSLGAKPRQWRDEFTWCGTVDPAAVLSIPAAIRWLESFGMEEFRATTHQMAKSAAESISEVVGFQPPGEDQFGSMVAIELPATRWEPDHPAEPDPLQLALWERHQIEIPMTTRTHNSQSRRYLRLSCYLYNSWQEIERLIAALRREQSLIFDV